MVSLSNSLCFVVFVALVNQACVREGSRVETLEKITDNVPMLQRLNAQVARKLDPDAPIDTVRSAPVRVLQIGTGNFLRAFSGWMFERMNRQGLFHGSIAVAQATPGSSTTRLLRGQDGCYTVLQRGLESGQLVETIERVTCVTQVLNPYADWGDFLAVGAAPDLRYVVSNTTEAGIRFEPTEMSSQECPASFPAQMAMLLHHRFATFRGSRDSGLVFLPCELTEANGTQLRDMILRHAMDWGLPVEFSDWVRNVCIFCNTLVDRIVPGYPASEIESIRPRLGYEDAILVGCEPYHIWVIEGPKELADELPFDRAGLNVVWTDDVAPYRTRKVRILNGGHTAMVAAAFWGGCDTVLETMDHRVFSKFVQRTVFDEIVPTLDPPASQLPKGVDSLDIIEWVAAWEQQLKDYAGEILNRFRNPTVHHRLLSITLNSTSKWKVRVLPSLRAYVEKEGTLPRRLAFSLAAIIVLYRVRIDERGVARGSRDGEPYELSDTPEALSLLSEAWKTYDERGTWMGLSRHVLGQTSLWDMDLNEIPLLTQQVAGDLELIMRVGMLEAVRQLG